MRGKFGALLSHCESWTNIRSTMKRRSHPNRLPKPGDPFKLELKVSKRSGSTTDIPERKFQLTVREINQQNCTKKGKHRYRWSLAAVNLLRLASENYVSEWYDRLYREAEFIADRFGKSSYDDKDIALAKRMIG